MKVRIQWLLNASDYDLYVHKGSLDGPIVASSGAGGTTSEEVTLNPNSSSIGTGDFYVHVVYFAANQADQYSGSATVVSAGAAPIPAPLASGIVPRYQNFTPPAAGPATLGLDAAEPSIGVNWNSEVGQNGGRSMYIALLQTLRITFTDSCPTCLSPCSVLQVFHYKFHLANVCCTGLATSSGCPQEFLNHDQYPDNVAVAIAWFLYPK